MGDAGFFKGTSSDQDARFSNKQRKLLKSMTFPASFKKKVNVSKVNMELLRPWITRRIKELLGIEDEVVTEFVFGMLAEKELDPRHIQIDLTGFLESNTPIFMKELWDLLLDAQNNIGGIPTQLIEEKKQELLQKKLMDEEIRQRIRAIQHQERASVSKSNPTSLPEAPERRTTHRDESDNGRQQKETRREDTLTHPRRVHDNRESDTHRRSRQHHRSRSRSLDRHRHRHDRHDRSRSRSRSRSRDEYRRRTERHRERHTHRRRRSRSR